MQLKQKLAYIASGRVLLLGVTVLLIKAQVRAPQRAQIAFRSNRDGGWEIYVMDADGENQRRLTDNRADDRRAAWSYDGGSIAFQSFRDRNFEIYVMDADGSNQRNLTNNPGSDYNPSWSPAGPRIAFYTDRDAFGVIGEIYVMDADGNNQRRLTNHPADDWYPAWFPDGGRIAFGSFRDGNEEIYVMDADGKEKPRNLTRNPAMDMDPDWSGPSVTHAVFPSSKLPTSWGELRGRIP